MPFPAEGIDLFFMEIYGGFGYSWGGWSSAYLGLASGLPQAGNPPYTVANFQSMYPQFFGPGTSIAGTVTANSPTISGVASTVGIAAGQLVSGQFPAGTVVQSVTGDSITASTNATGNDTGVTVFEAPTVPLAVIQSYLNLAYAALMWSRWRETWTLAMGWYIAHFLTLYLQSAGSPTNTAGQIAAQGLARGIRVSKAVDGVSASNIALDFGEWGAWALTIFGQQLITQARVIGAGAIYIR